MNGRRTTPLLLVAALAALVACAAPAPPAAPPAAPSPTVATLTPAAADRQLVNGGAVCDYDVTWLTVSGIESGAAATANAALDLAPDPADCTESATVDGGYRGVLNERGVLSTAYLVTRYVAGTAYPASTVQTFVIELATGTEVPLDDVLTPAGRSAFVDGCRAGLDPQLAGTDPCGAAFAPGGPDAPYTVTPDGLVAHVFNEVPHAVQALAERGVLVRWAVLGAGLRPGTPVAALAGR